MLIWCVLQHRHDGAFKAPRDVTQAAFQRCWETPPSFICRCFVLFNRLLVPDCAWFVALTTCTPSVASTCWPADWCDRPPPSLSLHGLKLKHQDLHVVPTTAAERRRVPACTTALPFAFHSFTFNALIAFFSFYFHLHLSLLPLLSSHLLLKKSQLATEWKVSKDKVLVVLPVWIVSCLIHFQNK